MATEIGVVFAKPNDRLWLPRLREWMRTSAAMASPPAGGLMPCTLHHIQSLLPGIAPPASHERAPSWSNRVNSQCFMIGKERDDPYYCQLWYDWDRGVQITVFVQKDDSGTYSQRFDEILPRGTVGPAVLYAWTGAEWNPSCCAPDGGSFRCPSRISFAQDRANAGLCSRTIRILEACRYGRWRWAMRTGLGTRISGIGSTHRIAG
jgi:hypothetical protein